MAIYHFSVKVISRSTGASALASAAYRSASRLHDQRLDRHHDFTNKAGVVHSEVLLPHNAPEHLRDREQLWNAVESAEVRKDAQLAREVEFALPRELDQAEGIRLAKEFVQREFVDRGMIADLNVHWDPSTPLRGAVGADGMAKPHAHVMLTLREVGEDGFGAKVRDWNRTAFLQHWREAWGDHVNTRLAEFDIDSRIDHRSLEAQGIDLEPQHKIGPAAGRRLGHGLEVERLEEHREIARRNGERILADPSIALDAITHQQSTFTTRDLARFVHRHSDGKEQFDAVMGAVRASPDLVELGKDGRGEARFTSRSMLECEQRLERATIGLASRRHHIVPDDHQDRALARAAARGLSLSAEQRDAFEEVTRPTGLSNVIGYAGTGKSAMLGVAREAWECAGYSVRGAALSGIAAEGLENGSGIASRTIASLEHQWAQGHELLGANEVLVIDEAGMIGTRQMERVIGEAHKQGTKVVLVGDPEQLQAIEAGAAFRSIAERHGAHELISVRRQHEDWQRDATRWLATGRTGQAIETYADHDMVHEAGSRADARGNLIDRWEQDRQSAPHASRIMLTHTNDEVQALNRLARERVKARGELGEEVAVRTERGTRAFASGDRVLFLRNERSLGVKNGSLGTVERATSSSMAVRMDDGRSVAFDVKDYADIDHGYAATIHKAQGMTVDKVHVLATPGLDRHAAYVALSRHHERVDVHYGKDDFADRARLIATLSRERGKDMAGDYPRAPDRAMPRERATGQTQLDLFERGAADAAGASRRKLEKAVLGFAHATRDIVRTRQQGLSELEHQRAAFDSARHALDALRPGGARDLHAAFARDLALVDQVAGGDAAAGVRVMDWEKRYRTDPQLRAETFVRQWRRLDRQANAFERDWKHDLAASTRNSMSEMAKALHRDPQLESILRNRKHELGLRAARGQGIGQQLIEMLGRGRGRGPSIGM
jgi:Ti-type conjugative transfer relaxase TraA